MASTSSLESAKQTIRETATWIATSDLSDSAQIRLRSTELFDQAKLDLWNSVSIGGDYEIAFKRDVVSRAESVNDLISKRSAILKSRGVALYSFSDALLLGKVLAYIPYRNGADGLAQGASAGLFDVTSCPGWDSWIQHVKNPELQPDIPDCILAWIPQSYIELANRGIEADPMLSLMWLSEVNEPELRFLEPLRSLAR